MFLSSVSGSAFASSVWSNVTRNLTGFGSGALVTIAVQNAHLAASANLDLRPVTGRWRFMMIGGVAGAAGVFAVQIFDGTSAVSVAVIAANGNQGVEASGTSLSGPRLQNNDATNQATYFYGGVEFVQ